MEWIGLICLAIVLCYSAYPGKVNKLERKVKKLEKKREGGISMSKIISELVGKECKITTEAALALSGSVEVLAKILDVDDEWIKFTYTDKKGNVKTKILRIESIDSVELIEPQ